MRQFVYNLLLNSAVQNRGRNFLNAKISRLEPPAPHPLPKEPLKPRPSPQIKLFKPRPVQAPNQPAPIRIPVSRPISRPAPPRPPMPRSLPQQVTPGMPSPINLSSAIPGLDKVRPILSDPTVQLLECPGPQKPLLVNRGGKIQTSSIILTSEEIDKIMQDISKETKIPLLSGVFKAAFGNYIITAVVSEFVGTRFAIQKKNPFQQA